MRILIAASLLLLAACKQVPMLGLTPFVMEIQQGNFVTQDMVDRLKPGMTTSQVRFALGTPLIVDPFRTDRWDYVHVLQRRGRVVEQRRLIVYFKDDRLDRIEGEAMPAVVPDKAAAGAGKGPAR